MTTRKPGCFVLVLLLLAAIVTTTITQNVQAADKPQGCVTVKVSGLKSDNGKVRIALYDSDNWFRGNKKPLRADSLKPCNRTASVTFADLPYGDYAVALHHDENDNEKMDKYPFGLPREQYGFSNNIAVRLGPPSFADARVHLNSEMMVIEIRAK